MAISRKPEETIDEATLERLIEANRVHGANVIAHAGGWSVVIQYGMIGRFLSVKNGNVRQWSKLETLVGFLRRIGIARFQVDATGYNARTKPGSDFLETSKSDFAKN